MVTVCGRHHTSSEWNMSLGVSSMSGLVLHGVRLHLLEHVDLIDYGLLASKLLNSFGISLGFSLLDLHVQDSELTFFLGDWVFLVIVRCKLCVNFFVRLVVLWLNLDLFANDTVDTSSNWDEHPCASYDESQCWEKLQCLVEHLRVFQRNKFVLITPSFDGMVHSNWIVEECSGPEQDDVWQEIREE